MIKTGKILALVKSTTKWQGKGGGGDEHVCAHVFVNWFTDFSSKGCGGRKTGQEKATLVRKVLAEGVIFEPRTHC